MCMFFSLLPPPLFLFLSLFLSLGTTGVGFKAHTSNASGSPPQGNLGWFGLRHKPCCRHLHRGTPFLLLFSSLLFPFPLLSRISCMFFPFGFISSALSNYPMYTSISTFYLFIVSLSIHVIQTNCLLFSAT